MNRWTEYVEEMYNDKRLNVNIQDISEGQSILTAEVEGQPCYKMKGKSPRRDHITLRRKLRLID